MQAAQIYIVWLISCVLIGFAVYLIVDFNCNGRSPELFQNVADNLQTILSYSNETEAHSKYVEDDDVVFLVITGKPYQDHRIWLQQQTWMRYTTQTYIFSETPSGHLPLIVLPNISDSYASNGPKFWDALQWAWQKFHLKKKWFVKVDDDTFVNVPETMALLRKRDYTKLSVIGRCGEFPFSDPHTHDESLLRKWTFVDGGAGIFISKHTMFLLNAYGFLNKSNVLRRHGTYLFGIQDAGFGEIITEIARREKRRSNMTFTTPFNCENERLKHLCSPSDSETKPCLKRPCATFHKCKNDDMIFWQHRLYPTLSTTELQRSQ